MFYLPFFFAGGLYSPQSVDLENEPRALDAEPFDFLLEFAVFFPETEALVVALPRTFIFTGLVE
jgi:hypothetical protein